MIELFMQVDNDDLKDAFDWAINNLIPEVINNEIFSAVAKGGTSDKFEKFMDMSYRIHYITGLTTAIRVIDYAIKKNIEEIMEQKPLKFKRSFFAYLFHDYNKIIEDQNMDNCSQNIQFILDKSQKLREIMEELNMNINDLCFTSKATENRTLNYLYNEKSIGRESLSFESNFCTLADTISSIYAKGGNIKDLKFGGITLIESKNIKKVNIQSTHLFSLTGIARISVRGYLEENISKEAWFLWDTADTITYVGRDLNEDDFKEIKKRFRNKLKEYIPTSSTLVMDDRRLDIPSSFAFTLTPENIKEFLEDDNKFIKDVLHVTNKNLTNDDLEEIGKYIIEINNLKIDCFSVLPPSSKNLRGIFSKNDAATIDCKIKVFLIRFIQLKGNDIVKLKNNFLEIKKTMGLIKTNYEEIRKKYNIFDKDNRIKSSLLVPLLISSKDIDFDLLKDEVFSYINQNKKLEDSDFDDVFDKIILSKLIPLPDVPDKSNMSIISGTEGTIDAVSSILFGVNHQTFTNRVVTSKNLSQGKIDKVSVLENLVRKNILTIPKPEEDSILLFSRIPGPIPIFDLFKALKVMNSIKWINRDEKDQNYGIRIGDLKIQPQVDNSILVILGNMDTDKDAIKIFDSVLNYAKNTGFQCLVTYANSPTIEGQKEIIRFEVNNSLLSAMKYAALRYNQLNDISKEINLIKNIANKLSKDLYNIMANIYRDLVNNPLSIFYYIGKIENPINIFSPKNEQGLENFQSLLKLIKKRGVKMDNLNKLAEIAVDINRVRTNDSTNEKTWLIRDPLEALEKLQSETKMPDGTKRPLKDFKDFVSGIILSTIERDENKRKFIKTDKIATFSETLITMLDQDFNGKVPTSILKSYLISAFEFLYVIKSQEAFKNGGNQNEI